MTGGWALLLTGSLLSNSTPPPPACPPAHTSVECKLIRWTYSHLSHVGQHIRGQRLFAHTHDPCWPTYTHTHTVQGFHQYVSTTTSSLVFSKNIKKSLRLIFMQTKSWNWSQRLPGRFGSDGVLLAWISGAWRSDRTRAAEANAHSRKHRWINNTSSDSKTENFKSGPKKIHAVLNQITPCCLVTFAVVAT